MIEHKTVLLHETIESLNLDRLQSLGSSVVVDCTAGYGGHLELLLSMVKDNKNIKVIGIDQDPQAIEFLTERFQKELIDNKLQLVNDRFSNLTYILEDLGIKKIDALYADLGVSTHQILSSDRGFSFQNDGPLDMRMGEGPLRAYDIVNGWSHDQLVKILKEYGQEPKARFIVDAIVRARENSPIKTTKQLEGIVNSAIHYNSSSKKNPATRTFMALRIAVNDEFNEVEELINSGFKLLNPKSRMSIISFHSIEDTIIKKRFVDLTGKTKYDGLPRDVVLDQKEMDLLIGKKAQIVKPFPIVPSSEELSFNPRSRSAKLRVIEKIVE